MRLFRPSLLLDERGPRYGHGLLVSGGDIVEIGPADLLAEHQPQAAVEELSGLALLPGTVNAHSHSFQSLLRGLGDDRSFEGWREVLYRFAPLLDEEAVYAAGLLAFGEMLLRGVTCVVDFFYLNHGGNERALAVAQAARDLGIRLVLARAFYDAEGAPAAFREEIDLGVRNARTLAARLQGDDRISVVPAPHSPHAASPDLIRAGAELAREWSTPWHIHVAEARSEVRFTRERYGATPLAWLSQLGVLDERARIVHGVWAEASEIDALKGAGGALVHCPGSNLFLGDGICPLTSYLALGISVALGCDSGSANSRLSIFAEMRLAALLQKGLAERGDALGAVEVFRMGTRNGAVATGLPLGRLEPGYRADVVAVDLTDLSLQPSHDLLRNVVYSLESSAIRHVYVHGEAVVRDGRLVRMAESQIEQRARTAIAGWRAG